MRSARRRIAMTESAAVVAASPLPISVGAAGGANVVAALLPSLGVDAWDAVVELIV